MDYFTYNTLRLFLVTTVVNKVFTSKCKIDTDAVNAISKKLLLASDKMNSRRIGPEVGLLEESTTNLMRISREFHENFTETGWIFDSKRSQFL
jgi:hypothetical protein